MNLYEFVGNDAISTVDPFGQDWFTDGVYVSYLRKKAKDESPGDPEASKFWSVRHDGSGGLTPDAGQLTLGTITNLAKAHEERHIKSIGESKNNKNAIPYKQVFCKKKGNIKGHFYIAFREGKGVDEKEGEGPGLKTLSFDPKKDKLVWESGVWNAISGVGVSLRRGDSRN